MSDFRNFKRDIMMRISKMEIPEEDGFWPEAIFMEDKTGNEQIIYIDELRDFSNENNVSIEEVVTDVIKEENPKNLALVFETRILFMEGHEKSVLSLLIGDIMDLECYEASYYEDKGMLKLENFETLHKEDYPDEALAVRRAMTYQNE